MSTVSTLDLNHPDTGRGIFLPGAIHSSWEPDHGRGEKIEIEAEVWHRNGQEATFISRPPSVDVELARYVAQVEIADKTVLQVSILKSYTGFH